MKRFLAMCLMMSVIGVFGCGDEQEAIEREDAKKNPPDAKMNEMETETMDEIPDENGPPQ